MKTGKQKFNSKKLSLTLLVGLVLATMFLFIFAAVPKAGAHIDTLVETLNTDSTTLQYETADAWYPPSTPSLNFQNTNIGGGHFAYEPASISRPEELGVVTIGATSFNKARIYNACKVTTDNINAWDAESQSTSTYMHHLWWRDILLSDTMKAGFVNSLIDQINFTMQVTWSLGFADNGGNVTGRFFIALGTTSTPTTLKIDNFYTMYSNCTSVSAEVRSSSNDTLSAAQSVSLSRTSNGNWSNITHSTSGTLVLRVGVAYEVNPNRSFWGAGVNWPRVDFQNPTCSQLSMSWTKPSLTVQRSGTNSYGTITNTAYGTYNNFIGSFSTTAAANVAQPNQKEGYYFSGWTSSNGPTGKNITGFVGDSNTLSIRGACDVPREGVTYTANFRNFSLDAQTVQDYTYAQDGVSKAGGVGYSVRQGPGVTNTQLPADITILDPRVVIKHINTRVGETGFEVDGEKPFNASTYSAKVTVEAYGSGIELSNGFFTYAYEIHPLNISTVGSDLTFANSEFTYNGTDRSFLNASNPSAGRISSNVFNFTYNSVQYYMQKALDDFVLDTTAGSEQYVGEWINSTNSQAMIADKTKKPHIIIQGNKNFTGAGNAYAKINPLKISEVQVAADMDTEIDLRYDTTYTGQTVKPDVILIRLTKGTEKYTIIAHDPQNADPSRRYIYTSNYSSHGEIGSYPAYQNYTGVQSRWCNGFFRLETSSYAQNVTPNATKAASFTIRLVLAIPNTDSMNFVDAAGGLDNAVITVKYNIPKRNVEDEYENTTNNTEIITDYSQIEASNRPYSGPIYYAGDEKTPVVSYVIIKASKVRLWEQTYAGVYYWNTSGIAFYSITNVANQEGSPTPPTEFVYNEKTYTVVNVGTYASSVTYGSSTRDNINVASGGIVNITPSDSAFVTGGFELWFPILPKDLSQDPLYAPGGGVINDIATQTYNFSEAINPTVLVDATFDHSPTGLLNNEVIRLIDGVDYTKTITNNTDITKEALVTVTGKGNYVGQITKYFTIAALDVTHMSNVSLSNLVNREYRGAKFTDTKKIGEEGYEDIILNVIGRDPYTVVKADYNVTGAGDNTNVAHSCWFDITFSGYPAGNVLAGMGSKFTGTKRVSFSIVPKSLAASTITSNASWRLYDNGSYVIYNGEAKKDLPIVTTGDTKTVVITDTARSVQLGYASNGTADYKLQVEGAGSAASWGDNPNAGLTSGSVTFVGTNNYTGTLTIKFEILPRDLSTALDVVLYTGDGSGYNQEKSGFNFTGSKIMPTVYKVEIDSGTSDATELDSATDYNITYGSLTDTQVNVFARKLGVVNIVGKGNYTGTYSHNFTIVPIAQTITFISPQQTDANVKLESIKNIAGDQLYADFEVNADDAQGREILVEARTTAIYPTARLITFETNVVGVNLAISTVVYTSCEIQEIDGVNYSVTKAKIIITSEKRYGRVRIAAHQYDNEITKPKVVIGPNEFINEGNYLKSEYSPDDPRNNTVYWLFMKRSDSITDSTHANIIKTYGNNALTYRRDKLRSYYSTNPNVYGSISLTSNNTNLVTVSSAGNNWTVAFKNAGNTTLTLQHSGYVLNESNAYLAYTVDIPVTIHKRNLEVSFTPVTVDYGEDASSKFMFTYRTWATDPSKGVDTYTGLTYQGIEDSANEIMTGISVQYYRDTTHKNSTSRFEGATEVHDPYSLNVSAGLAGPKAVNYQITTAPNSLTVLRKQLNASVSNIGESNVMRKEYGTANPTATSITYTGFVYNETIESLQLQDPNFADTYVVPQLQYISAGNPITELTGIGTYMIRLSAGGMKNYVIPQTSVSLIILPVAPIIELEGISTSYRAQALGYPFTYEEEGQTLTKQALIKPIRSDATQPSSSGNVVYQYRYEEQPWTIDRPRRAGTYSTRVIYTAAEGDNYKSTTKDFVGNIIISKVNPRISLNLPTGVNQIIRAYTAETVWGTSIQPTILGVGSDRPQSGYDIQVKFRLTGEVDWVNSIVNAGTYDLHISFVAVVGDNYNDKEQIFDAVFVIKDGIVSIELQDGCVVRVPFDGLEHSFDITKVKFLSMPNDLDPITLERKEIPGTASVMYSKDGGDTFTPNKPVDAGTYVININYVTEPGGDYEGNNVSFIEFRGNALFVIEHVDISLYLNLNLPLQRQIAYDAEYHYLEESLIQVGKISTDEYGPSGIVSMRYQISGAPSSPVLARVKDVGTYDVLLHYTEGENDNYKYTVAKRIQGRIRIMPVKVNITFPSLNTVYDFSGDYREVSVAITGLKSEIPIGTYKIEYSLTGMEDFTTNKPVDAGAYDVRVTYTRRTDVTDNYDTTEKIERNILEIRRVKPTIIINSLTVPLGFITASYNPMGNPDNPSDPVLVVFKGETRDPIGPPLVNLDNTPTVTFEYGVQTSSGYSFIAWAGNSFPKDSGRYAVRVSYSPKYGTESRNYTANTQTVYMCLTIENVAPVFALERKTAIYTGLNITANAATILNSSGMIPKGIIAYEYKKQNTNEWRGTPSEVGIYNVRVKYIPNTSGDSFASSIQEFASALEITPRQITIVPILGQGGQYGGDFDSPRLIYAYTYEMNGKKYFEYPTVTESRFGDRIDVAEGIYIDKGSFGYMLDVVDGKAWRDYFKYDLSIKNVSFTYVNSVGETVIENIADLSQLAVTDGVAEYISGNKDYVIDIENLVASHKNANESIVSEYNKKAGLFFSTLDANSNVDVIEVVRSRVDWTTETVGTYRIVKAGSEYRYAINLSSMTATLGNKVSKLVETAGIIEYRVGESLKTILVDEREFYAKNLQENSALYRSSDGYVYDINLTSKTAVRKYPIKVNSISYSYATNKLVNNVHEVKHVTLAIDSLVRLYSNQSGYYLYKDVDEASGVEQVFVIDIKKKLALKDLTYKYYETETENYFVYMADNGEARKIVVQVADLVATSRPGEYTYIADDNVEYYIDTNKNVVRKLNNVGNFHAGNLTISIGQEAVVDVDFHNIYYKAMAGTSMSRQTRLFEKDLAITQPKLPVGNAWTGSLKVLVGGAGEYLVERGSLAITTQNYNIIMSSFGVNYVVDKAPLVVKYSGSLDDVFNNVNKVIGYEVFGLKGDHTEEQLALIEEVEGDNVSATIAGNLGYRLVLRLDESNYVASNYYLVNNQSPYYRIRRATMDEIVFTPIAGGVEYNGRRYELKLEGINEPDITILYNGSTTIPTFVNPGTYEVRAEVSKPNYESQTVILTLTINKAVYTIGPDPVTRTLKYMDKLPTLTSVSNLGEYKLVEGQILHPSIKVYDWTFIPYDENFYQFYTGLPENSYLVKGKIVLNVEKAKPTFDVKGPLEQTEGSPVSLNAKLIGLENVDVTIRFLGADGTVYESLPTEAGKYNVIVEYLGNEEYSGGVYESTLIINPKRDFTWVWITIGVIAVLAILSSLFFLVRRPKRFDDSSN